jgi:phasin family protein
MVAEPHRRKIKMAKNTGLFDVDFSKIASEFKLPLKMPLVDVEQLMAIQRKNIEAFTAANQLTVEGVQALLRRQAEIVKETVEEAGSMVSELVAAGTPEDKMVRQVELLKSAYEHAISNAKELAELASKSNGEAAEIIAGRITDSLDEIKGVAKKTARKAA